MPALKGTDGSEGYEGQCFFYPEIEAGEKEGGKRMLKDTILAVEEAEKAAAKRTADAREEARRRVTEAKKEAERIRREAGLRGQSADAALEKELAGRAGELRAAAEREAETQMAALQKQAGEKAPEIIREILAGLA